MPVRMVTPALKKLNSPSAAALTVVFTAAVLVLGGISIGIYYCFAEKSGSSGSSGKSDTSETAKNSMAERQKRDRYYQEALEYMKTADLNNPTLETAQKAAYVADAEALKKIHANGFTGWSDPDIIINAARYGSKELIEQLISYGANINAESGAIGITVLDYAALGGNFEMVKYLVECGADINAKDKYGSTALDWARNDDVKEYLKSKGAKSGREL